MLQWGFVRANFSLAMALSVGSPGNLADGCEKRSGVLRLDLLRDVLRYLLVVIELHGEGGAPLTHGAQRVDVTEHVGERHHCVDDIGVAAHILTLHLAAPRVE